MPSFFRRGRGRPPHPDILTPAEWRVVEEVRKGRTNPEIAEALDLSPNTVKTQVSSALAKLGFAHREQLAAWEGEPAPTAGGRASSAATGWTALFARGRTGAVARVGAGILVVAAVGLAARVAVGSARGGDGARAARTPSPAATLEPGAASGLAPLMPGEINSLSASPYPSVYLQAVSRGFDASSVDARGSTLLYDRAADRVYEIRGASVVCFLPSDGPRPLALALTRPTDGSSGRPRALLLRLDPFEARVLDVQIRPVGRCLGDSVGGEHDWQDPHAIPVEVYGAAKTASGRVLPFGRYAFDPDTLRLTFQQVEPPFNAGPPDGTVIHRWPGAPAGPSLELVRRQGDTDLVETSSGRTVLVGVDRYDISPDGRLLATYASAQPGSPRHSFIVALGSGTATPIAVDITAGFTWSPDGHWLAGVRDIGNGGLVAVRVGKTSGSSIQVGPVLGPYHNRWALGWTAGGRLLVEAQVGGAQLLARGGGGTTLETMDLATARLDTLTKLPGLWVFVESPDGKVAATGEHGALALYSLSNGSRMVPRPLEGMNLTGRFGFSWSPSGRWLAAFLRS